MLNQDIIIKCARCSKYIYYKYLSISNGISVEWNSKGTSKM